MNYNSYDKEGKLTATRNGKIMECHRKVVDLYNANVVTAEKYIYLYPLFRYIDEELKTAQSAEQATAIAGQIITRYVAAGMKAVFKIKQ